MNLTELLLHPVRLRIVFAAMDGLPFTTSEMNQRLPDVSKASMYRHISVLVDGELLEVASEELVRGIVERHYRLVRVRAVIDPDTAAGMTKVDHRRGFAAATAPLIATCSADRSTIGTRSHARQGRRRDNVIFSLLPGGLR